MIWLRSAGALLAGFVSMALLVGVSVPLALALTGRFGPQPNAPYLAANIGFSLLAAIVGGFVCGWIAGRAPLAHSLALAAIVLVLGAVSALQSAPTQPAWYPWTIAVAGAVGVLAGGLLRVRLIAI
jgi:hypothetical protein